MDCSDIHYATPGFDDFATQWHVEFDARSPSMCSNRLGSGILLSSLFPRPDLLRVASTRSLRRGLTLLISPKLWIGAYRSLVINNKGTIPLLYEVMMPGRPVQRLLVTIFSSIVPTTLVSSCVAKPVLGRVVHAFMDNYQVCAFSSSTYTGILGNHVCLAWPSDTAPLDHNGVDTGRQLICIDDTLVVHLVVIQVFGIGQASNRRIF